MFLGQKCGGTLALHSHYDGYKIDTDILSQWVSSCRVDCCCRCCIFGCNSRPVDLSDERAYANTGIIIQAIGLRFGILNFED
jgi:hypothetical protein